MAFETFDGLAWLLEALSQRPTYKPAKDDRSGQGAELLSPAVYQPGTTRKNANVLRWARWAALDVDDLDGASLEAVEARFQQYRAVIYSTGSCRPNKLKFRVVFELSSQVLAEDIPAFWHALNKEVAEIGDAQTKDLSRMFYVPGQYPGAYNFFLQTRGEPIEPSQLIKKHPYLRELRGKTLLDRLPADMQKKVLAHRAGALKRPEMTWTSYRDCPFVSKKMIAEYQTISGEGWYRKMYSLMVSVASNAVRKGYAITEAEIAHICRTLDDDTGRWYRKRNFEGEAARALEYVYRKIL